MLLHVLGLPQHDEDFGQTLGVWGVDANTYVFIPLLGPSSNRDIAGIPVRVLTNVMFYSFLFGVGLPVTVPLGILDAIDTRARLSGPMKIRDEAALEPYLFVRDAYLQQRKHLIYDGNMPPEAYEDLTEEEPPAKEEPPKRKKKNLRRSSVRQVVHATDAEREHTDRIARLSYSHLHSGLTYGLNPNVFMADSIPCLDAS